MDFRLSWLKKALRWLGILFGILKKTRQLIDEKEPKKDE